MTDYVVYFACLNTGLVKIGRTGNVESRLSTLKFQFGVPLRIIRLSPQSGRKAERAIFTRFADCHIIGEIFEFHPDMRTDLSFDGPMTPGCLHIITLWEDMKAAAAANGHPEPGTNFGNGRRRMPPRYAGWHQGHHNFGPRIG